MKNEEVLQDLEMIAARCEAWRAFLTPGLMNTFSAAHGEIIHFNHYDGFDELICQFPHAPAAIISLFSSLMTRAHLPIQFERDNLFNSRGWCQLPLNCFVPVNLPPNEIPHIKIGLRDMPWEITSDCFKLYHHIKWNDRIAEMYFEHPNKALNARNGRNRNHQSLNKRGHRVGEQKFELKAKRPEMHAVMLAKVREECAKHHVRIIDLDVLDRLEGKVVDPVWTASCSKCGNYLPGHASGAGDICTC